MLRSPSNKHLPRGNWQPRHRFWSNRNPSVPARISRPLSTGKPSTVLLHRPAGAELAWRPILALDTVLHAPSPSRKSPSRLSPTRSSVERHDSVPDVPPFDSRRSFFCVGIDPIRSSIGPHEVYIRRHQEQFDDDGQIQHHQPEWRPTHARIPQAHSQGIVKAPIFSRVLCV